MKRMIMFLLAAALVAPAMAQYDRGNDFGKGKDKDIVFADKRDNGRYNDAYTFSKRELDYQISQINREYDYKIQAVKNKFFMNRFKKEQIIRRLEDERRDEINRAYAKFNDRRNRFDDRNRRHW